MAFTAIGATAALVSAGYGIYAGEKGAAAARKGRAQQAQAQDLAQAQALSQQRADAAAQAEAGKKTPDLAAILAGEQKTKFGAAGSTLLSGPGGVDARSLKLGRNTLLGE